MTATSKPNAAGTKVDWIRERELHRYHLPFNYRVEKPKRTQSTVGVDIATSPDTTLTALAQLCAVRLNASRAMISVIGKQTQYFLAESTKTLDLLDNQKSEQEDDGLWIGCSQVGKEGRLCERTIALPPRPGESPCFIVTDLSQDSRFNQLPFVTGPPLFKYYAGTPLTTNKGINIGSLFIIDTVVRPRLTAAQQSFLGSIAQIIMEHMETSREALEMTKVMRMSRGLNAFVEGKGGFGTEYCLPGSAYNETGGNAKNKETNSGQKRVRKEGSHTSSGNEVRSMSAGIFSKKWADGSSGPSPAVPANPHAEDLPGNVRSSADEDDSQSELKDDVSDEKKDMGHKSTITRAANLLCQSLDLQPGGGVLYLDTAMGLCAQNHRESATLPNDALKEDSEGNVNPSEMQGNSNILRPAAFKRDILEWLRDSQKPADVIGFSTSKAAVSPKEVSERPTFTPLGEDSLQYLLKRYPRGHLWTFDEDGSLSSSEEEITSTEDRSFRRRQAQSQRRRLIAAMLQKHFPGVCQLLFAPLWDSGASRWFSGCFVFNTSSEQVYSREAELNFVTAFNNSVMAEVSRLASIAADRQKGDFIGSISHEFRSPLHGILASAEFLSDTKADAFQSRLVDTILSCGRTLLDTINHILVFSKINAFERNWQNAREKGTRSRKSQENRQSMSEEAFPLTNLYEITNVAALTEEVIEGVYAGQTYQDISSSNITDVSSRSRLKDLKVRSNSGPSLPSGEHGADFPLIKEIEVVLDFAHEDYTFSTQPGGFRRIIMNIFGNALKYTLKGTIKVKLALRDMDGPADVDPATQMLEITIKDTGKGISAEYLRTSLYTPFCQENVLATGTGLGLSIVRSIVTMLGGSIAIRSEVEQGTEVTIRIPLMRAFETASTMSTPGVVSPMEASYDDPIRTLQRKYYNKTVVLYGVDLTTESGRVLHEYISKWFGLGVLISMSTSKPVDLIIIEEKLFPTLLEAKLTGASTVVLCSNSSRYNRKISHLDDASPVEFVSKPYGPYKLAKALRLCLEKNQNTNSVQGSVSSVILSDEGTVESSLKALSLSLEKGLKSISVQRNCFVPAGKPVNAETAISPLSVPVETDRSGSRGREFPFPLREAERLDTDAVDQGHAVLNRWESKGPKPAHGATEKSTKTSPLVPGPTSEESNLNPVKHTPEPLTQPQEKRPPHLLLVDDNRINLRLLETYLRKRKHKLVDSVENGELAAKAVEQHPDGYDIIFMDISMPVMNGFEATRAIREIERHRSKSRKTDGASRGRSTPALIIALTGLASGRDQADAFTCGMDMYLTKPVSFKEVGWLLDKWEANSGNGAGKIEGA